MFKITIIYAEFLNLQHSMSMNISENYDLFYHYNPIYCTCSRGCKNCINVHELNRNILKLYVVKENITMFPY